MNLIQSDQVCTIFAPIDNNGTLGVPIFPGHGSLQALGTIAISNLGNASVPHTPCPSRTTVST